MTEKIKGFIVTLDADIEGRDIATVTQAISMIKGVASVTGSVLSISDEMNRERVRHELSEQIYTVLGDILR